MVVTSKTLTTLLPKLNVRRLIIPVGTEAAVPTTHAASSIAINASSGHFQDFDIASRKSEFPFLRIRTWSHTLRGQLQRPGFGRSYLFSPLQVPAVLSTCYATVAQPYPESSREMKAEDEAGLEEVVKGCRVKHGELWNGDVKIHYVECGDKSGELVVLLHGFPNFWYNWKNQFQALCTAGYHVVAPDMRGYNTSSKPNGIQNYSRRSVVSDIVCLIDELGGGKPAFVVGHDWGGMVTWATAEDFPHKVKKAVVVNAPHPPLFSEALRSNFRQMRRSWYIGFFQLPWLPEYFMTAGNFKTLRGVLNGTTAFKPTDIERHVRAFQKAGAPEGGINYYRAAVRGHWSPRKEIPRPVIVELPVDMIWSEHDPFFENELAVIPKAIVPNSMVKLLPHCGHWPMWDDPKQFNALLLASLASEHATECADQERVSTNYEATS